jgi:hypothetical protein
MARLLMGPTTRRGGSLTHDLRYIAVQLPDPIKRDHVEPEIVLGQISRG